MLRALACLAATATVSAYEMPLSRRAVLSRVAAAAPLAGLAPAFADSNNVYLGYSKDGLGKGMAGGEGTKVRGTEPGKTHLALRRQEKTCTRRARSRSRRRPAQSLASVS